MTPKPRPAPAGSSTSLPLVLSALWPGLGHLAIGRRREAAWLGIPSALLLLPLLVAVVQGAESTIGFLIIPRNSLLVLIATVVSLITRMIALVDVHVRLRPRGSSSSNRPVAALVVVTIAAHLIAGIGLSSLYGFSSRVFGGSDRADTSPGTGLPQASSDIGPISTPFETSGPDKRLTILLLGSDSGTGYQHSLTDTMMVVTVDRESKKVTMVSIPRDLSEVPMYSGGTYGPKINSLLSRANSDRTGFPDGGTGTVGREIGYLIGIPIHYIAYVNLAGFADVIDAVGGVDVDVATAINDPGYEFDDGARGFKLSAGEHHLDARTATAFVRSRYGPGNNDFERARRQQELLLAIKQKLLDPTNLPRLPSVLDSMSRIVATNFPAELVGEVLTLSKEISSTDVSRYVLGPPLAKRSTSSVTYSLVPDLAVIAKWSVQLFGSDSRYASPQP